MANPVFFIPRPAETDGEVNRSVHETYSTTYRNYRTADGELLKWSASFPLPTMGQRIRVTMNGIGDAEVVGFFKEEGYVGVMTKALDPPTWLKEQLSREREFTSYAALPQWRKDGISCEFGAEVEELLAEHVRCPTQA
jgi:hypothetical protein